MKRAQMHLQFTWIFVLIAGFAFLFFFITLTYKAITGSSSAEEHQIITTLQARLKDLRNTGDIGTTLSFPHTTFTITCSATPPQTTLRLGGARADLRTVTLFSPRRLSGTRFPAAAKPLKTGFLADTPIYLVDEEHGYHFLTDPEGIATTLARALPNQTRIWLYDDQNDISYPSLPYHRIVAANTESRPFQKEDLPTPATPSTRTNITALIITPTPDSYPQPLQGVSQLTYYAFQNGAWHETGTSYAYTTPLLLGAVLSSDARAYQCQAQKTLSRLATQAQLYYDETTAISSALATRGSHCSTKYNNILQNLLSIRDNAKLTKENLNILKDQTTLLKRAHKDVTELLGCPYIY
ncbi:hypothetical protein D6783_02765 [Candidatus Woesearchaeota archaeon]|nr:MAG: hypothetical protein D6783_02765 [Candidatus Woesearchaeota archaeon]